MGMKFVGFPFEEGPGGSGFLLGLGGRNLFGARRLGMGFVHANHELIRDFDADGFFFSALRKMVFQDDGLPRVGDEGTGGGQMDVSGAIVRLDPLADERRIATHDSPVLISTRKASMVPLDVRFSYRELSND